MIIRLHSLSVAYDGDQDAKLRAAVRRRLGDHADRMGDMAVVRRSVDARRRPVRITYSVDVDVKDITIDDIERSVVPPKKVPWDVAPGSRPLSSPPLVVGGGPAGLFAAFLLSRHGYKPVLIDRGGDVIERLAALGRFRETRTPDPENNALFGLGGAGTFSDGKLKTGVNHPWLPNVLELLAELGAPQRITIDAKPHIGTDVLVHVVEALTARIRETGGEVRTNTRCDRLRTDNGRLVGVDTSEGPIDCDAAIMAIGHSARDTWRALAASGVTLAPKPFQMGIRVEHPQPWIDQKRYGSAAGHPELGAADYKLATRVDGVPVFSFCMCPGGETMPTVNEAGHLAVNGMSRSRRDTDVASSGLVVTLTPDIYGGTDLASCLAYQRRVEAACFRAGGGDYTAPAQRLVDFTNGTATAQLPDASYPLGVTPARLDEVLPPFLSTPLRRALLHFDKRLRGYLHPTAVALAPESRASSPIRIVRDRDTLESPDVQGLFPVGEGAGYAGGIMSSALDGLNAAKKIIERYRA